jgi:hypothetical protein
MRTAPRFAPSRCISIMGSASAANIERFFVLVAGADNMSRSIDALSQEWTCSVA